MKRLFVNSGLNGRPSRRITAPCRLNGSSPQKDSVSKPLLSKTFLSRE